jgi:GDP-D-mannose 3', 5'-epimerase
MKKNIIVTGSSGFIGNHLVRKLKRQGHTVIGVDIVEPKYEYPTLFYKYDLRRQDLCHRLFQVNYEVDEVYNLACLMGGMGYIGSSSHSYDIMVGSTLIVSNVLDCCVEHRVKKLFYSSSACVYNENKQLIEDSDALRESDAYPAQPDLMYGWQKLFSELAYVSAFEQHGLNVRVARFHNIFGTEGVWSGGKEKAPAALCRKVALAKDGTEIEVWGDGKQRRSFLYIDECLEGVERLMNSDSNAPLNIGSEESVSINELAEMVIKISGKQLSIKNDLTKPQGVRGRNSDNEKCLEVLGWKPSEKLYAGLEKTYNWVNDQIYGNV